MKFFMSGVEAYFSSVLGIINIFSNKEIDLEKRTFAKKITRSTYEI